MARLTVPLALLAAACSGSTPTPPVSPPATAPVAVAPPPATPPPPVMPAAADVPRVVAQGYDKPPAEVLALLHAPGSASPSLDPTHKTLLIVSQVTYPPMTQVAEPYLKLAGVRVEPRTRRKHDTPGGYGVAPCAQSLTLVDVATSRETPIALPAGGCVDGLQWAASGLRFTFRNTSHDAVELWIGDTTGSVRRLGTSKLNPMLGSTVQWLDDTTLLVKLVPDGASEPPSANTVVVGPSIQETDGKGGEFSTYEARDVLTSKHDEELFEFYGTSQLAVVDVGTGAVTKIGKPAVLSSVDAAPDGDHILVRSIQKPYSYEVTYGRFAHDVEVWDRSGNATTVAKLPVANRVPIHGVPTGPREHEWRPTEPATLVWAEALDGGDWNTKVPARDKVMTASAPFTDSAELTRTETRYGGYDWFEQPARALLTEYDDNRHWRRTSIVDLSNPKAKPVILWDMSSDEQFDDPGSPLYELMANGEYAVRVDGDSIYLTGTGAAPDGVRPFLDKLDLGTRKAVRMFRSEKTAIETVVALADDAKTFLTWRQSPTEVPNCMVRALGASIANAPAGEPVFASEMKPVTHLPDPTPQVRAIKKRVVRYKRKDGTDLSFTLMTPPGYKEGDKVPAILYAYPLDFANKAQAGQNVVSDATFTRLSDYQLLLASGYAIIDDAAFPIIGDPKKAYDTYLEQLVADAQAAVDKAVSLGIDRDRIGVTGHSHGALMTVNLLAHTKLFRAGVATSGSYNKTLTPFGFQSERRSVWKAPKVYEKVSPFFSADKIKLPLLIMHGADDANPGTTPLQAVKLYEAIRGNGGVARLVMLPFEPHWYSAMESNEQLAAEELKWFDAHVKNAPPRKK